MSGERQRSLATKSRNTVKVLKSYVRGMSADGGLTLGLAESPKLPELTRQDSARRMCREEIRGFTKRGLLEMLVYRGR